MATATRKLLLYWVGPFRVLEYIGPNACHLDLPSSLCWLHLVVNMSQLKPYTGDIVSPPNPVTLDGDLKYEL